MFPVKFIFLFIIYAIAEGQKNLQDLQQNIEQELSNDFEPDRKSLIAFWNNNNRKNRRHFENAEKSFYFHEERLNPLELPFYYINKLRNLSAGIETNRRSRLKVLEVTESEFFEVSAVQESLRPNATCHRIETYDCSYTFPVRYFTYCPSGSIFIKCIQTRNESVDRTCTRRVDFCCDGYYLAPSGYCERRVEKSGCGGDRMLRNKSGIISTPGYPEDYGKNLDCQWSIKASRDEIIVVKIIDLDTENPTGVCDLRRGHCFEYCNFDFIQIRFHGNNRTSILCGNLLPQKEYIYFGNTVGISFNSDNSNHGRGFKLAYSVIKGAAFVARTCPGGQEWSLCRRNCRLTCEDTISSKFGPWKICFKHDGTTAGIDPSTRDDVTCVPGCACPAEQPIWHNGRCVKVEQCRQKVFQCGVPLFAPSKKIVGGSSARDGEWPWIVQITNNYLYADCAGTLICSDWVVTAAHCFLDRSTWTMPSEVDRNQYWFHLGKYWKYEQLDKRRVESFRASRIIVHPEYNFTNDLNDLALIQLSGYVRQWSFIRPICLPPPLPANITTEEQREVRGGFPGINDECMAAGWGETNNVGPPAFRLKQARISIKPASNCSYNAYVWRRVICAGGSLNDDTCQGDSGGPLTCYENNRWYLRGITSFGDGCATGIPGGYTRISNFMQWIRSIIGYQCGV